MDEMQRRRQRGVDYQDPQKRMWLQRWRVRLGETMYAAV
jgi:hypothetical protein